MEEKYEKLHRIGCGTFGEVWLVKSICSGRSYVLKEVRVSELTEEELASAEKEAEVLARCKHINIIRYKESFLKRSPLSMCLVMEYADGGDLFGKEKEAIALKMLIPEETVMHWFIQMVFAVHYLHSNNILHRDLKTQNIFLTRSGVIKVGDFGIARLLRSRQELATTAIGTPYYLSPEICQRKPYNHSSDMWALGCILYELCTLRHPFEEADFESLIFKILQGTYEPLGRDYSKLIHDLTAVLLRTNPERRPTADQLLMIPQLRVFVERYIQSHQTYIEKCSKSRDTSESPSVADNKERSGSSGSSGLSTENESEKVVNGDIQATYTKILNWSRIRVVQRRDSQTQTPNWSPKTPKGRFCFSPSANESPASPFFEDEAFSFSLTTQGSPAKPSPPRRNFSSSTECCSGDPRMDSSHFVDLHPELDVSGDSAGGSGIPEASRRPEFGTTFSVKASPTSLKSPRSGWPSNS